MATELATEPATELATELGIDAMDAIGAIDIDIELELLQRCFEARRQSARLVVQTDDWCRAAMAPEAPLCSCCAADALV